MDRNRIFDMLLEGQSVEVKTDFQAQCVRRFNEVMICEVMGRSWWDLQKTPVDFYEDTVLILSKRNAIQRRNNEQ